MNPVIRSLIAALATFAAFWYIYWVPFAIMLEIAHGRFHWMWIIRVLGSMAAAAVVAQYTWRHKSFAPQGLVSCIIAGAAVMGGIGFSAGWFGPDDLRSWVPRASARHRYWTARFSSWFHRRSVVLGMVGEAER